MHDLVVADDEDWNNIGSNFGLENEPRYTPFEIPELVLGMLVDPAFGENMHPDARVVEKRNGFGDGGLEETTVYGVFVGAVGREDVTEGEEG